MKAKSFLILLTLAAWSLYVNAQGMLTEKNSKVTYEPMWWFVEADCRACALLWLRQGIMPR